MAYLDYTLYSMQRTIMHLVTLIFNGLCTLPIIAGHVVNKQQISLKIKVHTTLTDVPVEKMSSQFSVLAGGPL